jgi:hypothetical protein
MYLLNAHLTSLTIMIGVKIYIFLYYLQKYAHEFLLLVNLSTNVAN